MESTEVRPRACLTLLFVLLSISWTTAQDASTAGLIVTTPMSWVSNTNEKICLTSRSTSPRLQVTSLIISKKDNSTLKELNTRLQPGERKCLEVHTAEEWNADEILLQVKADKDGENVFNKNATVTIYRKNIMMFLQTDKPVYKPSDTVRIRILTVVGPDMTPVVEPISKIYIEDPAKTRIMQWTDVNTTLGLGSVELHLSSEPPLGRWTIHAIVRDQATALEFNVKEYVLPKYSVDITNNASVYQYGENVKWKVCATYTFGEPVNGNANTYICTKPYAWTHVPKKCVWHNDTQLEKGCYEFTAKLSDLNASENRYGSRDLDLYAEVAEKGTGITFNATSQSEMMQHKYTIDFKESPSNYKPGMEYFGKALLKDLTGLRVPNMKVYLTFRVYGGKKNVQPLNISVVTDTNGVLLYNISAWFTSNVEKASITVEADLKNTSLEQTQSVGYGYRPMDHSELGYPKTHSIKAWYSNSDTYLQIQPLAQSETTCKIPSVVKFTMASRTQIPESAEFHFQITSHGNLIPVNGGSIRKENSSSSNGIFTNTYSLQLNSATQEAIQGNINIVIFYIRPDGEMIADAFTTSFIHCFKNKVSVQFSDSKARPGHETSFSISADSKSLCSIVVVDKSIKLMGASYLTSADVQDMMKRRYNLNKDEAIHSHFSKSSCVNTNKDDNADPDLYPMPMVEGRAPRSIMMYPGGSYSEYVDSQKPFEDTGLLTLTDLTLTTRPCRRYHFRTYMEGGLEARAGMAQPIGMPGRPTSDEVDYDAPSGSPSESSSAPLHRNFFPETWLWDLHLIGDSGELKVPVTLPHTITEWIGNGYCINPQSGLGVSPSFSVTGFQSFFMSFTLPYSMIRGETVAVPVSVFNYLAECLSVTLKVDESTQFTLVNNSKSAKLSVCGQQTEVHTFFLVPRELGKINFTVRASSKKLEKSNSVYSRDETDVEDIVTREILVEAEGKPEEVSKSAFVCGSGGGDWTFDLPSDVVRDSERSDISVIGDVMGPALSGLDSLLRVPTGCGEQNMLGFAPNIFVLKYLNKTKRLTPETETKALDNMRTGYQRELNYRHDDGSYSAFGKSDPEGSIWLTAFVIKCFAQSKPYIAIDDKDLKVSVDWMIKNQQENGCFPQIGRVLHKGMTGGVQGDSAAPLTAFILVALLEAGVDPKEPVITNAVRCLDSHNVEDVYTLSVMAYAYSKLDDGGPLKAAVMAKLQEKAISENDMKHWESSPEVTHDDYHHSSPANIEATSYVLLSLLQSGDVSVVPQATPVVRWMSSQRNSFGGFSSTQDTILGLQSLAEYAGIVHSDNIDLNIQVAANGVTFDFDVTSENSLLLQRHEGLATHKRVHYNVEGTGCALVQAVLKFNRLSLQEAVPPSFELTVNVKDVKETKQKCNERTLNVCARYNGTEVKSNMAIIGIKMVSGWIPVKDTIHKLKNQVSLSLKRYDIEKNSVQLYFDEIDGRKRCFTIDVEQDQFVQDSKPAIVHAFDYYQPAAAAFSQYNITSTCLLRKGRSAPLSSEEPSAKPVKNGKQGKDKGDKKQKQKGDKTPKPKKKNTKCPVCDEEVDNASLEEFCDSQYVFKVRVGRGSSMTLKEIVRSKSKPSKLPALNSDMKYRLPKNCQCGIVAQDAELLVSTSKRPHQKDDDWILQLKKGVKVLRAEAGTDCPVA